MCFICLSKLQNQNNRYQSDPKQQLRQHKNQRIILKILIRTRNISIRKQILFPQHSFTSHSIHQQTNKRRLKIHKNKYKNRPQSLQKTKSNNPPLPKKILPLHIRKHNSTQHTYKPHKKILPHNPKIFKRHPRKINIIQKTVKLVQNSFTRATSGSRNRSEITRHFNLKTLQNLHKIHIMQNNFYIYAVISAHWLIFRYHFL